MENRQKPQVEEGCGMSIADTLRRWSRPGTITIEDGQRVMRLPSVLVWQTRRIHAAIIRYPHLWRWTPYVISAKGIYDDGRPFRVGTIGLFDAQIEWTVADPPTRPEKP